jgi:hypothetical protein
MHATDSDTQNWFLTHARIAASTIGNLNDDPPLIYFPTTENSLPLVPNSTKPGSALPEEKEVPFQNDIGPLRVSHEHPP